MARSPPHGATLSPAIRRVSNYLYQELLYRYMHVLAVRKIQRWGDELKDDPAFVRSRLRLTVPVVFCSIAVNDRSRSANPRAAMPAHRCIKKARSGTTLEWAQPRHHVCRDRQSANTMRATGHSLTRPLHCGAGILNTGGGPSEPPVISVISAVP